MGVLDSLDFTSELARHMAGNTLWAYGLLALTTMPPLIPNSALLVTGGVLAAHGQLDLGLVLLVVAGSALVGDMVIHRGGRALRGPVIGRFYRSERRRRLLEWAATRIERHGVPFVIACRFLPSGRLLGGVAAGVTGYPARRYLIGAGIAEAFWATYSVGLGYLGGRATGNAFSAIAVGLGVSFAVGALGGLAQYVARRRAERAARTGAGAAGPLAPATAPLRAAGAPRPTAPSGATALSRTPAASRFPAAPRTPAAPHPATPPATSPPPPATSPPATSPPPPEPPPPPPIAPEPRSAVLSAVVAVLAIRVPLSHVPAVQRARSPTGAIREPVESSADPTPSPRECGAASDRWEHGRAGRPAGAARRRGVPCAAERSSDRCRR
ncbi:DedA family protein [Streptantibioticus silvisoli]|uniref:VTT domain-containing protein n=1 Tax=Streptantibioticus silvisoli TaxID=2705255 RepID=A0ABT6W4I2_9ACTN|nr:VTT domain-containing protein [Streptantibioticus silvisoli]MDI5964862.1 VTT domain-containing protein [Streptantibioticus silvisoli]